MTSMLPCWICHVPNLGIRARAQQGSLKIESLSRFLVGPTGRKQNNYVMIKVYIFASLNVIVDDSVIQKAFSISRPDTLKPPLAKISDKIPLVLTFHLFNYNVRDIISCNQILKNDPEMAAIFTDNHLISFKCNKNIRDNLVRSALRQNLPEPAGTFSCSHACCYTC